MESALVTVRQSEGATALLAPHTPEQPRPLSSPNRIQLTHPDGAWFGILRDGLDRPYWLYSDPAAGVYYSSYRPDGLPAGQSRGNGASTWTSRDAVQRFNGLGHYYGGGTPADVLWLYQHNPASQITSATRDNEAYAWTGHYAVNRNYTANGLNQYSASGALSPTYDARGNLQSAASSTGISTTREPAGLGLEPGEPETTTR